MSAQRYPQDFDVILAGAPAHDFAGITAAFVMVPARSGIIGVAEAHA